MATYQVTIRELVFNSSVLEVEAEDWEQAEVLAMSKFMGDGCKWDDSFSNGLELEAEEE